MTEGASRTLGRKIARSLGSNAIAVAACAIGLLALWRFVPSFYTPQNAVGLTLAVSSIGMVACTMLFCLASGDFDLSVESVFMCSGVTASVVMAATHSVLLGIAAGLGLGLAVGLLNGVLIAKCGINALIATLGTMLIARGVGLVVSNGKAVAIAEEAFFVLGKGTLLGLPVPVLMTIGCFVLFGFLLNATAFGPNTLALGGNREAARLAGIAVDRTKITIFAMQGLVAALAGIIMAARAKSGQPKMGEGFALQVISACVLGGVSLQGGVGTIQGVLVGVLVMGAVQNVMSLTNTDAFWQYVINGVILLAAVLFDIVRRQRMDAAAVRRQRREFESEPREASPPKEA